MVLSKYCKKSDAFDPNRLGDLHGKFDNPLTDKNPTQPQNQLQEHLRQFYQTNEGNERMISPETIFFISLNALSHSSVQFHFVAFEVMAVKGAKVSECFGHRSL